VGECSGLAQGQFLSPSNGGGMGRRSVQVPCNVLSFCGKWFVWGLLVGMLWGVGESGIKAVGLALLFWVIVVEVWSRVVWVVLCVIGWLCW